MQPYERLKQILTETGLKQAEFAESIGTTKATISRQLSGIHKIDKQVALSIQAVYGYRATWLLTGEGGMFLSDADNGGMAFTNEIDAYGNISQKFYQPSESKKSKTKSADVVSLEGLTDEQRKSIVSLVESMRPKKNK